jgi:hypothetical protein
LYFDVEIPYTLNELFRCQRRAIPLQKFSRGFRNHASLGDKKLMQKFSELFYISSYTAKKMQIWVEHCYSQNNPLKKSLKIIINSRQKN